MKLDSSLISLTRGAVVDTGLTLYERVLVTIPEADADWTCVEESLLPSVGADSRKVGEGLGTSLLKRELSEIEVTSGTPKVVLSSV